MRALVLNSAHGKYPRGSEAWVRTTVDAVNDLAGRGYSFVCGTEPMPWSLTAFLAGESGADILLLVAGDETDDGIRHYETIMTDIGLDPARTTPLFLGKGTGNRPKESWRRRDRIAIRCADTICPVSIRPGGRLDTLLAGYSGGGRITDDFRIERFVSAREKRYDFSTREINTPPSGEWLVHWTRTSAGPWPGERSCDFFRDMLERPNIYVRSAAETLIRILKEGVIRGSSWRMPRNETAVSFSALQLEQAPCLMRWRKRYVRYSFEPYGIGIRRASLTAAGAGQVDYAANKRSPGKKNTLLSQSPGERGDWKREQEWRVPGDVVLDSFSTDDIVAIAPDESALIDIAGQTGGTRLFHPLFAR